LNGVPCTLVTLVRMPSPPQPDYRQHLELETPEQVMLDYEVAGVGSRTLAAVADWTIITLLIILAAAGLALWKGLSHWLFAIQIAVVYAIIWGYSTGFEAFRRGQTPGKRWMGIRVIRDTGSGVTFPDAAARNLLLPVDFIGMIGLILIAVHPRGKRLGDMVAGTVVVRDRPVEVPVRARAAVPLALADVEPGVPLLSDADFQLLRGYVARVPSLPEAVRHRFSIQLAARFASARPARATSDPDFLAELHDAELARRRGRFGARGAPGSAQSVAERLVARKSARWQEFQALADRVSRQGLDALSARELPDFAARYREVAADLARARTYGADTGTLAQLERLVAAGHNALYRMDRQTWRRMWQFISHDCPAAIVESWRYVVLAFLVFTVPALGGYALLRDRPGLAAELIPDAMLERAEAGAARQAQRQGYVQTRGEDRPVMATSIIVNNVRVAFSCFAFGIVFGIGSLLALAYNGLELGAVSGHFANAGLLGYLWTFVLGHGALELFSIWVAGAAGFLLGRALIAPGELPRKDAIVLAGRRAMRMIGAVFVLLIVAGMIEGFVSSSESSLTGRVLVSGGSVVFLLAYLLNGARTARAATPA
jgi:uncharacterized membrane protein SpoIIM required for sporulation/uncharacterized RDD family membrane protein YckC